MTEKKCKERDDGSLNSRGEQNELQLADLQVMPSGRQTSDHESSLDGALSSIRGGPPSANMSGNVTMRQKVTAMQNEVYLKKIREYRVKVEKLEQVVQSNRKENDLLVKELADAKTKIAVLEEHKLELSMQLVRERRKQNSKA